MSVCTMSSSQDHTRAIFGPYWVHFWFIFISRLIMPLKCSKLGQLGQRGKFILELEIITLICLCLFVFSLGIPWIKLLMCGPPSETSGLVISRTREGGYKFCTIFERRILYSYFLLCKPLCSITMYNLVCWKVVIFGLICQKVQNIIPIDKIPPSTRPVCTSFLFESFYQGLL